MRRGDVKDRVDASHGDDSSNGRQVKQLEKRVEMLEKVLEAKTININQLERNIQKVVESVQPIRTTTQNLSQEVRQLTFRVDESTNSIKKLALPLIKDQINKYDQKVERTIHKLVGEMDTTKKKLHGLCEQLEKEKEVKLSQQKKNANDYLSGKKGDYEKFVDTKTPYAHLFHIQSNYITYKGSDGYYKQVLLNVPLTNDKFVLHAHIIHTQRGDIMIGVVDRLTQAKKQQSFDSGNAVCYYGYCGNIHSGNDGESSYTITGVKLKKEMKVEMEVELDKGMITFVLQDSSSKKKYQQKSDILSQSHRQFVPYFEMADKDDSIKWTIK